MSALVQASAVEMAFAPRGIIARGRPVRAVAGVDAEVARGEALGVVAESADEVVVMYAAQVVERGTVAEVFARPLHPYTRALLAAVPDGDAEPEGIPGVVPRPDAWPPGCRFAPRCPHAMDVCRQIAPELRSYPEHRSEAACHLLN